MKVFRIGMGGVALAALISCTTLGSDGKRIDYEAVEKKVPTLDVPPDLTVPTIDERYQVPQGDRETVATYSDYTKGGVAQEAVGDKVLPDVPGVRLQRDGTKRWLEVSNRPDDVWSVVKGFWLELGLVIKSEDQAAGVMETDWAENRAKIPQGTIRSVLGKVFNRAYASGQRDQYVTRLERSKSAAGTEIHITHRGMIEVYSPDLTLSKWQARANDPELEAILLQRLMVRFGVSETQAASAVIATSTLAPTSAVAATDPLAASGVAGISTSEPPGTASLRELSGGNLVIVMNDPFDKSWRKVGLAIASSGLSVEDKDREKGIYFLHPVKIERGWFEKLKFWKARVDSSKHYRVEVKDSGAACAVSVSDQDGANSSVTKQMVETIYKNINK